MLVDQLRHVLVAGKDEHVQAVGMAAVRQGADDVVGFDLRHGQQGQAPAPR